MNKDQMEYVRSAILIDLILNHRGEDNAVHSRELERRFGISGRKLREQIRILRTEEGNPVCSSCRGYYYPVSQAEIIKVLMRLKSSSASYDDLCISLAVGGRDSVKVSIYGGDSNEKKWS